MKQIGRRGLVKGTGALVVAPALTSLPAATASATVDTSPNSKSAVITCRIDS